MIAADLNNKATLGKMSKLVSLESIETPGHEPTTSTEELMGRSGYDPDFLDGWNIPLPKCKNKDDMLKIKFGEDAGSDELKYEHFSVVMSKPRRMPMLTAVNIDGKHSRSMPRESRWWFDGRLDKEDQFGDELYYKHGLDRGHMVRREDPVWGKFEIAQTANRDTFHFTNSCPQMPGVNQVTWVGLENYVLKHAKADEMRVSVFTGPFFTDNDLPFKEKYLIPLSFWKVVAIVLEDGRPSATAYKVSQEKELSELEFVYAGYKTYQISIKEVMKYSNIDFGSLIEYDGFSQHEIANSTVFEERIDQLESIRI